MANSVILNDLIKALGLTLNKFEEQIEAKSTISKSISRRSEITTRTIEKIVRTFPNVNRLWLVSGEGDMFVKTSPSNQHEAKLISPDDNAETYTNKFGNTFIPLEDGRYLMGSPIVPQYVKGGPMAGFADFEYFDDLPKHYTVVDKIHRGKYLTFKMIGESMDYNGRDYISEGALITVREIKKELWVGSKLHLNNFKDFVIEHTDGMCVKRITAHDTERYIITCHSLNEDKEKYPDFDLNLNDVLNLFNIIKVENPR